MPFVEAVWGRPGVPPTIGQKTARSLGSYVSGLIAGSQPSNSDFRSFSKLLAAQFLLQIKLFRGPGLPKQRFKAQKSRIELKMSKSGFGLDASDWENCALRTAPASLQNFRQTQTGRHSAFLPFVGAPAAILGSPPPRSARKWLVLLGSYVSGLIAGSQPSKSDFRNFFQAFGSSISAPNQAL